MTSPLTPVFTSLLGRADVNGTTRRRVLIGKHSYILLSHGAPTASPLINSSYHVLATVINEPGITPHDTFHTITLSPGVLTLLRCRSYVTRETLLSISPSFTAESLSRISCGTAPKNIDGLGLILGIPYVKFYKSNSV